MNFRKAGKYRHLSAVCLTKGQISLNLRLNYFFTHSPLDPSKGCSKICVIFMIGRNKWHLKNYDHTTEKIHKLYSVIEKNARRLVYTEQDLWSLT